MVNKNLNFFFQSTSFLFIRANASASEHESRKQHFAWFNIIQITTNKWTEIKKKQLTNEMNCTFQWPWHYRHTLDSCENECCICILVAFVSLTRFDVQIQTNSMHILICTVQYTQHSLHDRNTRIRMYIKQYLRFVAHEKQNVCTLTVSSFVVELQ